MVRMQIEHYPNIIEIIGSYSNFEALRRKAAAQARGLGRLTLRNEKNAAV